MHTVSPAKDVLAKLKVSSEVVSKESLQCRGHLVAHFLALRRWLGRSVRYSWGFPGQKPVLAVEA